MANGMAATRRHFSMIRGFHLADLFTIANAFCGVAAVFQAMWFVEEHRPLRLYLAAALVPIALVFDFLDGRVARWRHQASPMVRELDSLADVISFGVAPAAIAFAAGLRTTLDQAILLYFTACGVSRLARYNITAEALAADAGKVQHFEGTPIPTSLGPLGLLMVAFATDTLWPVRIGGLGLHLPSLLFLLSGSLMISKTLRIPKP
jgi:CDP-diacylglycerol--serine O-phosphatidyltransferase